MDQGRPELVDLLAQIADVGLDHVGVAVEVVLPHVVEDLRLRECPPRVEHQVAQQLVLGRRELDAGAPAPHLVRVVVELEVGEHETRRCRRR